MRHLIKFGTRVAVSTGEVGATATHKTRYNAPSGALVHWISPKLKSNLLTAVSRKTWAKYDFGKFQSFLWPVKWIITLSPGSLNFKEWGFLLGVSLVEYSLRSDTFFGSIGCLLRDSLTVEQVWGQAVSCSKARRACCISSLFNLPHCCINCSSNTGAESIWSKLFSSNISRLFL